MDCRQANQLIDSLLDGQPGDAQVEEHLASCHSCRGAAARLHDAERALRTPEFRAAPPGMLAEFHQRLNEHTRPRRIVWWPWVTAPAALAAAAACALLFVNPIHRASRSKQAEAERPQMMARNLRAPSGSTRPEAATPLPGVSNGLDRSDPLARSPQSAAAPPPAGGPAASPGSRAPAASPTLPALRKPDAGGSVMARRPTVRRRGEPLSDSRPMGSTAAPVAAGAGAAMGPDTDEPALSPALVAALNRPVNVSVTSDSPSRVAGKLCEAADVALKVEAYSAQRPISIDARGVPLWQALEKVAEQSGLMIEPTGDGLRLVEPAAAEARKNQARGVQDRAAEPDVRARAVQRAAPPQAAPAGGFGARGNRSQSQVWSHEWGDLPSQQFSLEAQSNARLGALQQQQALHYGKASAGQKPPMDNRSAPAMNEERLAVKRAAVPREESFRYSAAAPAQTRLAAKPAAVDREAAPAGVSVSDGRVLLISSADGSSHAALLPVRQRGGSEPALRYRLWLPGANGKGFTGGGVRNSSAPGGAVVLPLLKLGGDLEWRPSGQGKGIVRSRSGGLKLCPTTARGVQGLDPKANRWSYR